ncbi:ABC transporter substrate-binding protein [Vallitalea okinawensis]|uniref:ABC transporter substrate-binding protein n=1 Tax=Vallitalea okinawensis TaxID=2078660 RepID=UPI001A9A6832|nr:ABC transporter substrate-binding protein [Vallitalea okinawensis]
MKSFKKVLALLLSVIFIMGLLTACGETETAKEEGVKTEVKEEAKNEPKEEKEETKNVGNLNYVSMWNEGEPQAEVIKAICADFEAETGTKVEVEFAGRDVLTKIRSRLLMNDAPDIIDQDLSELNGALMKEESLVLPLTDFFAEAGPEGGTMMDVFNEDVVRLYEQEGNLYYMPYSYITSGFFYDKSMFEELSLEAPNTWEEFVVNNEALLEAGIAPLALDGNISFYNAYYYYWSVIRVLGKGALYEAAGDKTGASWDDPGFLKAAELVYEISKGGKNHFQDGYEGSNYPAGQSDWALGKSGSVLCGSWIPVETKDIADADFNFGFYPFPMVDGGVGSNKDVEAYLIGCAIPKDAPNPEGAKELLRFMMEKEYAEKYATETLNISARKDVAYPDILADIEPVVSSAETFHLSYDGAMAMYSEWFANVFYPIDNQLVFGELTPEEFIESLKAESIKYWANK